MLCMVYYFSAWLEIKFCGQITRNLEGFFTTPFVERGTGNTRMGAATMFAATEARTCFPCFDEPDLKAVFAIETTVDEDLTVISNMPIMDSRYYFPDNRIFHSIFKPNEKGHLALLGTYPI